MAYYDSVIFLIKIIVVAIVIIGLIGFILRPLIKGLTSPIGENRQISPYSPKGFDSDEEIEIPATGDDPSSAESIIKMAKADPLKTTILVRNWLRDKK